MFQKTTEWIRLYEKTSLFVLVLIFLVLRMPGVGIPLHQDEYKWPMIVNPVNVGGYIPHPPLGEFIFRTAGGIVGYDVHFRLIPLFFSVLNLILFYYVLKNRFGRYVASIGALLFTFSFFSILASLMVDTDGAVIPFFFLCMFLAYDRVKGPPSATRNLWILGTLIFAICGLFVKVSFILILASFCVDILWQKRKSLNIKILVKYMGYATLSIVLVILLLIISQKLFLFFNLTESLKYWQHFAVGYRNWLQTGIQVVKAFLYVSPLLVLTPFMLPKSKIKDLVPFIAYLFFGLIFYIILFDFSIGALDRYLQFIIIPLCALSAVTIAHVFKKNNEYFSWLKLACFSLIGASLLFTTQFIRQNVPPLYPKSEWISRVFSLHLNFLFPFTGGSGPAGFYVSILFVSLVWAASIFLVLMYFTEKFSKKGVIFCLFVLSIMYNGVFIEEYLFGKINGSSNLLFQHAKEFIVNHDMIKKVVVYNDIGGADIQAIGKYERRLYVAPQFESGFESVFSKFKGHLLFIDIPKIDPQSLPAKYIDSCTTIYTEKDRYISARIVDCSQNLYQK